MQIFINKQTSWANEYRRVNTDFEGRRYVPALSLANLKNEYKQSMYNNLIFITRNLQAGGVNTDLYKLVAERDACDGLPI
jgi:hypothetical protein